MASYDCRELEEMSMACHRKPIANEIIRSDKLQFHFGRRSVCHVRTDGVFSSEPGFPCLAYSDLESIQSMRRSHIDRPPSSRFDVSMARVRSKKLRRVTPPNELEDPYMAATIIALA